MDLEKEFGVDEALVEGGVWVTVDDGELLIAALSNQKFDAFLDPHRRRYRRMGKEMPESLLEEAMAKFILLGWKNLKDGGKEIESTEKNRLEMLRRYRSFKSLVLQVAMDPATFRPEEAERKNSKSGPSGSSGSVH